MSLKKPIEILLVEPLRKLRILIWRLKRRSVSKKRIRDAIAEGRPLFLEIGAGEKAGKNGWLTLDIVPGCDIYWDLRNGIPFPSGAVQKIYSSHFFEHLTFKDGQILLQECLRVLAPGGLFSIAVPNAKLYINAYINGSTLSDPQFFGYKPAYNNTTRIDYVNHVAYMDGQHKYMFDEENLVKILQISGFKNVHLRKFDPNLDLEARDFESIYAEAEK